jgi:undecaprenyl-diphosphatase
VNDLLQAALLGLIEGITEFLPISSTGHLLIAEHWLGARSELFNVAIQAGAILASVLVFWPRLAQLLRDIRLPESRGYIARLALAFAVTAAGGFIAKKLGLSLPETVAPIAGALIVGGVLMLVIEKIVAARPQSAIATWAVAIAVGIGQLVAAVFPGTSRSAASIFAAMLAGMNSRPAATEFSFLVGIPTMFAATGYEFLKLHHAASAAAPDAGAGAGAGAGMHEDWPALVVAFVVATVVAYLAVRWLLRYLQGHRFTAFAWYRIAAGLALLALVR